MKKIIAGIAITLIIVGFVVFQKLQSNEMNETTEEGATLTVATSSPSTQATSGSQTSTKYKDGTYTGDVSSAGQYGDIQVKAIISGGKITDIQYVQFPNGGGHTAEVTSFAQPALKQEAIAAQNANVDIVSGATQDTEAFIQSLQSALDQAKV